jgi:hypothetical protein
MIWSASLSIVAVALAVLVLNLYGSPHLVFRVLEVLQLCG